MFSSTASEPGRWPLAISFLIVVLGAIILPPEFGRYKQSTSQVERSRQIIETSQQLLSALKDAETGQRGYLLAHSPEYLEPYQESIALIPQLSKDLHNLIGGDLKLVAVEQELDGLVSQKLAELAATVKLTQENKFRAALERVQSGQGRTYMEDIRNTIAEMNRQQFAELTAWAHNAERLGERALGLGAGGIVLLFGFLLAATVSVRHARRRELQLVEAERAGHDALQESEARFRSVADSAPVMIWVSGMDGQRGYFNKGWLEFTGRTMEQESSEGWTKGIHPEDVSTYLQAYKKNFGERTPFQAEYRLREKTGDYRWTLERGVPRSSPKKEFMGFIGSAVDIHDRKTLEEDLERRIQERTEQLRYKEQELLQSRKIEAIGRLAGGVAHDFNNLLTGIFGIAEEIRGELPEGDPHRESLDEILKAAQRASSITKQLLAFGRRQIVAPVVLNFNAVLSDMSGMLKRLIGEDIQLNALLGPDAGHVRIDPGQAEQIIINLVLNARDAMPEGGKITIETANVEIDETYAKKHFEIVPGSYVLLAISDTGLGMDQNTLEHVFEPFFTTKEKGRGSGMGLATVYGIVKQNSGDIFLYTSPGAGTTFKIYLPRTDQRPTAVPASGSPDQKGDETILLVEDEDIVRRMANRALSKAGYKVLEARNGKEALEISATYEKAIHLLLTDVIMPGLNGRQVAELLASQRPEMKVLYTSGYTENIIAQRGMLKPGIAFIEKSFTAGALRTKVREILDLKQENS